MSNTNNSIDAKLKAVKATAQLPKDKDGKPIDQVVTGVLNTRGKSTNVSLKALIDNPLLTLKTYPSLYFYTNLKKKKAEERDEILKAIAAKSRSELIDLTK